MGGAGARWVGREGEGRVGGCRLEALVVCGYVSGWVGGWAR